MTPTLARPVEAAVGSARFAAPAPSALAGSGPATERRGLLVGWVRSHSLLSFVLLTYVFSWAYWIPLVSSGQVVRVGSAATAFPGLAGPLIAAFTLTALTGGWGGVRDLASRVLRWRVPARWWLFAVGTPLALLAVAFVVLSIGPGAPALGRFGRAAGLPQWGVLFVWAAFVAGGIAEETGWRGYALPLLRREHGLLKSSLLLVPIWAGWHLPLFFLVKSYRDMGLMGVPGFLIALACGSVILAWLYESAASSVLIAAVWHATYNLTSATDGAHGTVAVVVSAGVIAGAVVLAGRLHRQAAVTELGVPRDG